MSSKKWFIRFAATAATAAAVVFTPVHAATVISVQVAPPPPRVEAAPAPRAGNVWVPGHWRWNGSQHIWVPGRFLARRAGWTYAPERWVEVNGRWEFREGTWVREGMPGANVAIAQGPAGIFVQTAPPPPRVEAVPVRRNGQVWVPGHWQWNGTQHVWVAGHYLARRTGWIYAPARWVDVGGRWQYREGTWVRPGAGFRDSDGDGIADRFDNDRDGDGIPNSRDAVPGNPNRR
jgi:hypothetical protein